MALSRRIHTNMLVALLSTALCLMSAMRASAQLPKLPTLPIPKLPIPKLPTLPKLPNATTPSAPNVTKPSLPTIPGLPNLPMIPGLPTIPNLPKIPFMLNFTTLPTIPISLPSSLPAGCPQMVPDISKCGAYVLNPNGSIPTSCCNVLTTLINMSLTKESRKTACTCVKNISSSLLKLNQGYTVFTMGFPLTPLIDCDLVF